MKAVLIEDLPASPKLDIWPFLSDHPRSDRFVELEGIRLRRAKTWVLLETVNEANLWFNWYVQRDGPAAGAMTSLDVALDLAYELALKLPGSRSATLVEKRAPNAAKLLRSGISTIEGVDVFVVRLPVSSTQGVTLLLTPLDPDPGDRIDRAWLEAAYVILPPAWSLKRETEQLTLHYGRLSARQRSELAAEPATHWGKGFGRGQTLGTTFNSFAESVSTIRDVIDAMKANSRGG